MNELPNRIGTDLSLRKNCWNCDHWIGWKNIPGGHTLSGEGCKTCSRFSAIIVYGQPDNWTPIFKRGLAIYDRFTIRN